MRPKHFLPAAILIGAALTIDDASAQGGANVECTYNREAMLALDERSFDGDPSNGWRVLARSSACFKEAADLIHDYRGVHADSSTIVSFNEAQLRACIGETETAMALFEDSKNDAGEAFGWNLFIESLIAYLRRDRDELTGKRRSLENLPGADELPAPLRQAWQLYLDTAHRLVQCFDCEWEEAYRPCLQNPP